MSATEQLIERVKTLDEAQAREMLRLLDTTGPRPVERTATKAGGIWSVMGYAKKYNHPYKTTAEWMAVLREGEKD